MTDSWRAAALGALGGAVLSLAAVFGLAASGNLPGTGDGHIHDYLMAHPRILDDMIKKLKAEDEVAEEQAEDKEEAIRQHAVDKVGMKAFFDPKIAFVTGPENAKASFVEFFDYNCPYCRASVPAVQKFYAAHKNNVRFAFIEFPIKGENSVFAARAALAARKQPDKYLAFHFALMSEESMADKEIVLADAKTAGLDVEKLQADMQGPEIADAIAGAMALSKRIHVDGTPEFIVNGHSREGAVDDGELKELAALK